jgi:hypothetical protein
LVVAVGSGFAGSGLAVVVGGVVVAGLGLEQAGAPSIAPANTTVRQMV